MAILGQEYRIAYQAVGYQRGMTNVVAYVLKPDDAVMGPIGLADLGSGPFGGLYTADLMTTEADPEGDYILVIISPTEQNRAVARVNFQLSRLAGIEARVNAIAESLVGASAVAVIDTKNEITAVVREVEILRAEISTLETTATVKPSRSRARVGDNKVSAEAFNA